MSEADNSSRSLLEQTLDRSIEAHNRLDQLAQALFAAKRTGLSDRDRATMLGILGKLIARVERQLRGALAERLSEAAGAPHDLIMALAADSGEWSRSILQDSGALGDPRLIELALHRSLEHQLTAKRDLLTGGAGSESGGDAVKALLDAADGHVAQAATAYLVDQAKRSDGYQEPLIRTDDLAPALIDWLCWQTSGALRHHILAHQQIEWSRLDNALERATSSTIVAMKTHARPWQESPAVLLAKALDESGEATAALMIQLIQQGEFALFEAVIGQRLDLEPPLLRRIIHGEGAADLAVACRALGMTAQEYDGLTSLLYGRRGTAAAAKAADFTTIDSDEAQAVLRFWQRDPAFQAAITGLQAADALKS